MGERFETISCHTPIPIARTRLLLDQTVGQARPADTIRVDGVQLCAVGANDLRTDDRSLQRLDVLDLRRQLQKHDEEMTRIALCFRREGIACHDLL
ncbi:MAG: hypothetical protein DMF57_17025, partial [Acidobacteria bacterium]